MKTEDFCAAFCEHLALHEVPIGYVLKTPFKRPDGDAIGIYFRRADDGTFRIEDDGQTLGFLEASGVDLDSETRFEALADLLKEYSSFLDERESLIYTANMQERFLPAEALRFMTLMLRIQDLLLLAANRVRSTFRDDLINLVERQFGGSAASIDFNSPLQDSMKDYQVDIIVRSPDGRSLAIYAATSELKALEALLFWREARDQKITNNRAMLVVETAKPRDIKERTYSRVLNSGLLIASMDGEEISIGNKMRENLIH
jgi:hypothetical protein